MKLSAIALPVALSLPALPAHARKANPAGMASAMTMLATNARMALDKYGIDANAMNLWPSQLGLIGRVPTDPDADTEGNSRQARMEFIVGM